jgi:hypothetical protein
MACSSAVRIIDEEVEAFLEVYAQPELREVSAAGL